VGDDGGVAPVFAAAEDEMRVEGEVRERQDLFGSWNSMRAVGGGSWKRRLRRPFKV
jgi:hypothetical protein